MYVLSEIIKKYIYFFSNKNFNFFQLKKNCILLGRAFIIRVTFLSVLSFVLYFSHVAPLITETQCFVISFVAYGHVIFLNWRYRLKHSMLLFNQPSILCKLLQNKEVLRIAKCRSNVSGFDLEGAFLAMSLM